MCRWGEDVKAGCEEADAEHDLLPIENERQIGVERDVPCTCQRISSFANVINFLPMQTPSNPMPCLT